jgi:hypothetical protein
MGARVKKASEDSNFHEVAKLALEHFFDTPGHGKNVILVFMQDGIIVVRCILIKGEEDTEQLHEKVLYTIVDLIQRVDPTELFVGYEGFYLMEEEEKAVRVLIGTIYSDDEEQVWLAQIHEGKVGEWQDISDNPNRCGFDGLWQKAKAYLGN